MDEMLVKASPELLRAVGVILRDRVEGTSTNTLDDLTQDDWTLIEEIATGFENR